MVSAGPRHTGPRSGAQAPRNHGPRRVESLERRQNERLKCLLKAVDSVPLGAENGPHQYTYKPSPDSEQDTVVATETCSVPAGQAISSSAASVRQEPAEKGRVLKLHPDEPVRLAPRLKAYLHRPSPTWPELVDAADWLRHDLDVSNPLWGKACFTMGREQERSPWPWCHISGRPRAGISTAWCQGEGPATRWSANCLLSQF